MEKRQRRGLFRGSFFLRPCCICSVKCLFLLTTILNHYGGCPLSIKSRVSSYALRFLDKAGVFYFILSAVFALSGEMDERSLYLLLLSSFFGLILVFIERYKRRNN